jgi:hypothetical protein
LNSVCWHDPSIQHGGLFDPSRASAGPSEGEHPIREGQPWQPVALDPVRRRLEHSQCDTRHTILWFSAPPNIGWNG